jgi:hypothetical protein
MVTVSVQVPDASPDVFAPIDRMAGAVPEAADNVSQDCVLPAVQLSVPPPVFEIVTGSDTGLLPPATPENVRVPVDRDNTGDALLRFSVTLTVAGEPPAPEALMVTVSVQVPAASPDVFTPIDKLAGAVPEDADKVSHGCVLPAVQLSVPPPVFEIVTGWEAGLLPPAVAENVRDPVDRDNTGEAGG